MPRSPLPRQVRGARVKGVHGLTDIGGFSTDAGELRIGAVECGQHCAALALIGLHLAQRPQYFAFKSGAVVGMFWWITGRADTAKQEGKKSKSGE